MRQYKNKNKILQKSMIAMALTVMMGLSIVADASMKRVVELTAGKADTVTLNQSVADVLVANPAVADVGSLRSNRLYIVGKAIGDTNVLAFDEEGNQLADITVRVKVDEDNLSDVLKEFFPKEEVSVRTVNSDIILTGKVSNPGVANRVRDLASRFVTDSTRTIVDLMKVQGEQQVMLKVKVIEANRNALREYGVDTDYDVNGNDFLGAVAGTGLQSLAPFGGGQLYISDDGKFGPLTIGVQGLEEKGLVNTLAEPNLTAISGETAGFLAGGEYPVPVGRDQDGNITLEFKSFGVSLNFTPTVLSEDRISLQLSTEVSAKSDENSVTLINTVIPGLSVRRAETTVQMSSGGTIMIAGLIKSDTLDSLNGFPGIQDVPILGELFKSKSFQRNETELLIMVTPYIVEPFANPDAVREAQNTTPTNMMPDGTGFVPPPARTMPAVEQVPVQKTSLPDPTPAVKKASYRWKGEERTASMASENKEDKEQEIKIPAFLSPQKTLTAPPVPSPQKQTLPEQSMLAPPVVKASAPMAPVPKPTQVAAVTPVTPTSQTNASLAGDEKLSNVFMQNLKDIYGGKTPSTSSAQGAGYIVD